jgi:hypothetical protein
MPRMAAKGLSTERMRELARTGAEVTLKQLRAEIVAIERAFLRSSASRGAGAPFAGR